MLGYFLKFKAALEADCVFSHFLIYKSYEPYDKNIKKFENNDTTLSKSVYLVVAKALNLVVPYLSC